MSYAQAVKWCKRHPAGTRQPMNFSTGSGFWPSLAWLEEDWTPYADLCAVHGVQSMTQRKWYDLGCGQLGQCAQQLEMKRIKERRRQQTMRKMENSSIDLRARHHYREAVRGEVDCTTCAHRWDGIASSYCEALTAPHDPGTPANLLHTCDLHEERS